MKKASLAVFSAATLLSACAAQMSPQERMKQETSSLNVYDDNRVVFKTTRDFRGLFSYNWTDAKDEILAVKIHGRFYNAKDISTLRLDEPRTPPQVTMSIRLKSGETVSETVPFGQRNSFFVACNTQKRCGGLPKVSGIDDSHLFGQGETPRLWIEHENRLPFDSSTAEFLPYQEKAKIDSLIAGKSDDMDKARKKKADDERDAAIALERRITAETDDLHKHVRVGSATNCGQVFEVRRPMVGVQTMNGAQFIDLSRLYGPSAKCRFINGQYVGR